MEKLRYNRVFKESLLAIFIGIVLFGSIVAFFVISKIQYNQLVSDMESLEATIVDIDHVHHRRGPSEQKIYIDYVVERCTHQQPS